MDLGLAGATVDDLAGRGSPDAFALQADITKPDEVTEAFREVESRWGELNILVNATGPATSAGSTT